MDDDQFEMLRDLLILSLLKSGISYDAIADVVGGNPKTLKNRFPIGKIVRKEE